MTLPFNELAEKIHTENKNIRRKRVTLSYSPGRLNRIKRAAIEKDRGRDRRHTAHDKIHQVGGQINFDQHPSYKAPFQFIVRLFQVYLDSHIAPFPLLLADGMNKFLDYIYIYIQKNYLNKRIREYKRIIYITLLYIYIYTHTLLCYQCLRMRIIN